MVSPDISVNTYLCRRDRISWAITIRFLLDSPSVFFLLRDASRNEFMGITSSHLIINMRFSLASTSLDLSRTHEDMMQH
jgi:hypothetical protein